MIWNSSNQWIGFVAKIYVYVIQVVSIAIGTSPFFKYLIKPILMARGKKFFLR